MTEKERSDTIAVVMVEILGHCDEKASDDHPVKVSFHTLLRWYDQLDACLCAETSGYPNMSKFTPADCPHCEYDRRFPGFEGGGWIQQDNNGPIVSCPVCNDDGSHPQGPVEVIHQRRTKVGGVAVNFTFGRIR